MFVNSSSLGYIGRRYSTQVNSSKFTYKKFYKNVIFKEGTNDEMKKYYMQKWYYPITEYPSAYYKLEDVYESKKTSNGVYDWIKYQFKKNSIIFKVLLENYKNTAWYIYKFRILSSHYNKHDIGYNMNDLLKNTIFKVIEEENKLALLPVNNDAPAQQASPTPEQTLLNLQKDEFFFLKDLDYDKFLPFQQDKAIHGVVYDFFKISLIMLVLEELSLVLLKTNYLRPPFFAHIPETLIKHVDGVVFPNLLKINTLKHKNKNEVAYMNPHTCPDTDLTKKFTVEYLNLVYLDDLIFINRLLSGKSDFYRDELVYKCMNRNLFPNDYKRGSYLSLPTDTFKELYFEYLDRRYSETLMNSKNGIHNIFDLS